MQEKRKNKPHCSLPFLPALAAFRDSNPLDLICCLQLSQFLSDSTYLSLTENNGKIAYLKYCFCDLSVKRYVLHFPFLSCNVTSSLFIEHRIFCRLIRPAVYTEGLEPGGALPYIGYIGMCRCEGYGFQAVYSGIGYINQRVWV